MELNTLLLSRLQFGVTTLFHFIFVPLTLGLSIITAVMQTWYVRTGDETYKDMAKFWGKLFLINFAMGVVTGIVQEFQFGMNFSEYSRFVGDIFGAPLAIEALMAFFIESTFIGVWVFGWDKLSKGMHLASIWLVAFATNLSSLWILIANSWMQHPVGYVMNNGRAEMVDFLAVVTNSNVVVQFPHVVLGGFVTGAFFVLGVSAYRLLAGAKDAERTMFRKSMNFGVAFGLTSILLTILVGHFHGQHMVNTQPMKLAAAEGLWESEDPAGMSMFQIGNMNERRAVINLRVPLMLSILSYNSPTGLVMGMNDLNAEYQQTYGPGDYIPPAWLTYWSFRAMVGAGFLMAFFSLYTLWAISRGKLETNSLLLKALVVAIILPYLANLTGWTLTEMGRQPWIVFGMMTVEQGLSPNLTVATMLISLIGFTVVYGVLMVIDIYLLQKYARGAEASGDFFAPLFKQGKQDEELKLDKAY